MTSRTAAALLVALTLSAGCGGEEEKPSSLPPVTSAPSATPSATSAVPPSAQAETPQAAAAFARFFYAEVERAFNSKDPSIVEALSAPGCEACDLFAGSLTALRDNNERITPVDFEVVFAEAPAFSGPEARVDLAYNTVAVQRFDASGELIYEEPATKNDQVQLTLVRSGSSWLVQEVQDA